jgi:hypothetical protein
VDCSRSARQIPGITNAIAIAAYGYHAMALLADGTVLSWGSDEQGQQGDGVGMTEGCSCVPTPQPIAAAAGAVALGSGYYTSAALFADGSVRNWGGNGQGQLGRGQASPLTGCQCLGPGSPSGLPAVTQIGSGGGDSIVILPSGGVLAWGLNNHGQIGNGTKASEPPCYCVPAPTPVSLDGPLKVDSGGEHVVALLADGTLRAWGYNYYGTLGTGSSGDSPVPVSVPGIAGASDGIASESNSYAIIGPSQALRVELTGDSAGAVGGRGLLCPPACSQRFPQAQVEALRAEPHASFAGFSDSCSGAGACQVRMDGGRTVTATFGRPTGTRIDAAKIIRRKRFARFSFSAPGAITGYQCMLVRKPLRRKAAKSSKRRKRRRPRFRACSAPRRFKHLKPGRYAFRVRALDVFGADAKPALRRFKLRKPRRLHHRKAH